jgi:hypothetical protein
MPEDRVSDLTDLIDEMFGLHPPFWTLVNQTAETILRLAEQGNVCAKEQDPHQHKGLPAGWRHLPRVRRAHINFQPVKLE